MILDILCFRNKVLKSYTNPTYSEGKLENLEEGLRRGIYTGGPAARAKYKNLALYHLGTFNDQTGKHDLFSEPELLLDCDDVIASLPKEEE